MVNRFRLVSFSSCKTFKALSPFPFFVKRAALTHNITTIIFYSPKALTDGTIVRKRQTALKMKTYVELSNGRKMPIVGLGTWQAADDKETETAVHAALSAGYRHIDTAYMYQNEKAIGRVLKEWLSSGKVKREELFIVTKLPPIGMTPEKVPHFLKNSLESLQLDYIDLYLIHLPVGFKYVNDNRMFPLKDGKVILDMGTTLEGVWKAMEAQVDAGLTKAIGISNFDEDQVERIAKCARILPSNHQMELQVYFQQRSLREVCTKFNISICAYAPFGSPGRKAYFEKREATFESVSVEVLEDPVVNKIAQTHGKTPAQVLLRFLGQEGFVTIPKSVSGERIKSNFQVFDFELSPQDMEQLRGLDKGEGGRSFTLTNFPGIGNHPECPRFAKGLE